LWGGVRVDVRAVLPHISKNEPVRAVRTWNACGSEADFAGFKLLQVKHPLDADLHSYEAKPAQQLIDLAEDQMFLGVVTDRSRD
jgi:hypothetical protein